MSCPDAFALYKRGRGRRHTKQARPSTEPAGSKTPRVRRYSEDGRNYPWMLAKGSVRRRPSWSSSSPSSSEAAEHLRVEEPVAARAVTGSILLGLLDHLWIPASYDQTPTRSGVRSMANSPLTFRYRPISDAHCTRLLASTPTLARGSRIKPINSLYVMMSIPWQPRTMSA